MSIWLRLALVAGFGALGASCRFLVGVSTSRLEWGGILPYAATLIVNLLGSFLFGFIVQVSSETSWLTPHLRLAILTGFLGAFTTFSAYSFDTISLYQSRGLLWAGAYVLLQNVGSISLAFLGLWCARSV